jgi:hypothetical protein
MSSPCPDCAKAQTDPDHGGYSRLCHGCEIRAIATAPREIRTRRYGQIRASLGEAAALEFRAQVLDEHQRIQKLKGPQ